MYYKHQFYVAPSMPLEYSTQYADILEISEITNIYYDETILQLKS